LLAGVGYRISRQTGSHIRLTVDSPTQHRITSPAHDPLRVGTLAAILSDVAEHRKISRDDLLDPTPGLVQLFELNTLKSAATGKLSAELWVNPKMASGSVDVTLKFDPSLSVSFTDAQKLPAGWTVLDSVKTGKWTLAGIGLNAFNAPVNLGVLEWTTANGTLNSVEVKVVDAATEGEMQRPYQTTLALGAGGSGGSGGSTGNPADTSGTTGGFTLGGLAVGQNALTASKAIGEAESGAVVGGADAIAALKISLGMNPNLDGRTLSPYQVIAADANEDGKVSAADALAVLKMTVGRADAPEREWLFVRESEDFWDHTANGGAGGWTLNRKAVNYDRDEKSIAVSEAGGKVNLVAVLKGDVNGSWQSPQEAPQQLPETYFRNLSLELNTPVGQWGIGG
jgi:predicted RNA binding protein YcfA (HicA-like mRNA interferase family)